jgi:hypothetical protein
MAMPLCTTTPAANLSLARSRRPALLLSLHMWRFPIHTTQYALESALGTAAVLNAGTGANNIVQLDSSAKLPAVDGSQLTNLPGGAVAGSDTHVIFNDAGAYAGDAGLTYAKASDRLTVVGGLIAGDWSPPIDSTTAVSIWNAARSTRVVTVDSANRKMILNGYLLADRWLGSNTNLFLGDNSGGAGNLSHTTGTTGWYNIGLGYATLQAITTGYANMAIGSQALISITTGYANMAVGRDTATTITTGANNVAIGASAGNFGTTGFGNVAIGAGAASSAANANYNVAIGFSALQAVASGPNVAIGQLAAAYLRSGASNVLIGSQAGTGVANYNINNCTFIGHRTGNGIASGGSNNTFIGYQAGDSVTSGANNLLIGYDVDTPTATTSYYLNIGNLFTGDMTPGALKHGFYNVAAVARQVVPTGSSADTIITALQNLGLFSQS